MSDPKKCSECQSVMRPESVGSICPQCLMKLAMPGTQPSSTPASAMHLKADQLIGKFPNLEIKHLIGHGGMASVYHAKQTNLGRDVALKILSPQLSSDPAFQERFEREARTLARLAHPNIVTLFDFGKSDDMLYLIMELVDGVNLRDTIMAGTLTAERALEIVPDVCNALQYAHDQGVIHRDIKPENILIDRRGNVKIADFGLAKLLQPAAEDFTLTATRQVLGTLKYMAPEQIEKPESVDHRADLYSLGVVFYELLTGELPIGRFSLPSELSSVGSGLDDVVMKTLEKEPDRRYQQASQVRTAVEQIENVGFVGGASSETGKTNASPRDHRKIKALIPFHTFRQHGTYGLIDYVSGLARIFDDVVELQYEKWMGQGTNETGTFRREELVSAEFNRGLFQDTVELQTSSIFSGDSLYGNKMGIVKLYTRKKDASRAAEFVDILNEAIPGAPIYSQPTPIVEPAPPVKDVHWPENWKATDVEIFETKERLKVPRVALWYSGILTILIAAAIMLFWSPTIIDGIVERGLDGGLWGGSAPYMGFVLAYCGGAILAGIGGIITSCLLWRLTNYPTLLLVMLLTVVIFPANLLLGPFLIWAFVVLLLKKTQKVFRHETYRREIDYVSLSDNERKKRKAIWIGGTVCTCLLLVGLTGTILSDMEMRRANQRRSNWGDKVHRVRGELQSAPTPDNNPELFKNATQREDGAWVFPDNTVMVIDDNDSESPATQD